MSLERRLSEALHRADSYQPSVDLFARLSRSIEEDQAHRRRVQTTVVATVGGLAVLSALLAFVAEPAPGGAIGLPKWALQLVMALVMTVVLITLGPVIRRLGEPLLSDVFHMSPATGERFSRLLDIAYYLFFGGGILLSLDLTDGGLLLDVGNEALIEAAWGMAIYLAVLGLAHAGNLLFLPLVGLMFSSLTRRARRNAAGVDAPPISERARKVDRLTMAMVLTATLIGIGGTLAVIVLVIAGGL